MNLHDRDIRRIALQEGISQGEHQKAIETAKKLIEYGDSAEKIALVTGLSQEIIVQLQNEIAQQ